MGGVRREGLLQTELDTPLPVPVTIVGGSSSGTEYTEDAPAATDPAGSAVILVRQDTPAALVSTDGDNVAQRGTNYGAAYVQVVTSAGAFVDSFSGGGGAGGQYADGAVRGTATGTLAMGDDGTNIQSVHVDSAGDLQIDVLTMPTVAVTGALTDTQLRATPVPVSGTITANAGSNLNTSLLALEATQTLQATAAKQDTGNTSLGTIKTNTDPLVTAGGGGYVRQDSTATIAKETGGNLATVKTNTDPLVASGAGGYVRQDSTATIAKETGGNLATTATNTGTVSTNTAPLVTAAAGGYIRQDSTATIAKETGGNLATIATNSALAATAGLQTSGNASLTILAALSKVEDAASADADTGIPMLTVRQDVPVRTTSTDADYTPMRTDANGRVWIASDALGSQLDRIAYLLEMLSIDVRLHSHLLAAGLNITESLDTFRNDPTLTVN